MTSKAEMRMRESDKKRFAFEYEFSLSHSLIYNINFTHTGASGIKLSCAQSMLHAQLKDILPDYCNRPEPGA